MTLWMGTGTPGAQLHVAGRSLRDCRLSLMSLPCRSVGGFSTPQRRPRDDDEHVGNSGDRGVPMGRGGWGAGVVSGPALSGSPSYGANSGSDPSGACVVRNVHELRLGLSNTTRDPEGILSHDNRKS
jgi:hypothetical protein